MKVTSVAASAHNPTVMCVPREVTELRRKIDAVVEFCLGSMTVPGPLNAGIVDADTIWPTEVLDLLGIDYGPGSELASRQKEE